MIRNVVLGRLRAADSQPSEQNRGQVEEGIAGILALKLPGLLANDAGWDAQLRDGGWDFAITNDWQDERSYQDYDADPEHNRWRQQIGAACEQVARVQFHVGDPESLSQ